MRTNFVEFVLSAMVILMVLVWLAPVQIGRAHV